MSFWDMPSFSALEVVQPFHQGYGLFPRHQHSLISAPFPVQWWQPGRETLPCLIVFEQLGTFC